MTVSDRASALLKLADSAYLDSFSFPDLFHFMQDLGQSVGGRLGLQVSQASNNLSKTNRQSEGYESLKLDLKEKERSLQLYKTYREQINKLIHPFNENNELVQASNIEIALNICFTKIRCLAKESGISISLEKGNKILNQIPDLANGLAHWVSWLNIQIQELDLSIQEKKWLVKSLLPYAYWQVHQGKKTSKKKDKNLNEYYHQRVLKAKSIFEKETLDLQISEERKEYLVNWAFRQVATFHRASSQVEGRNGYLAFVHHANKGIPEKRKKVLTVIHNFDIRRTDGKTPAQRLFNKDFQNLFEFVLNNIEELPKPRKRKNKYTVSL